ncbi:MAG: hypothetical protein HOI47_22075 [Candidatus Scalindua sp.]|jgi:hypothetical protein|nr:hypothetical protein [Candidatus Scalindua sp.]
MTMLSEFCPWFEKCSVNNCPLHSDYPNLSSSPKDPETTCHAQKRTRLRIAEQFPGLLKYDGLSKKEFEKKRRRDNRTPEQRLEDAEWGKLMAKTRALRKSNREVIG